MLILLLLVATTIMELKTQIQDLLIIPMELLFLLMNLPLQLLVLHILMQSPKVLPQVLVQHWLVILMGQWFQKMTLLWLLLELFFLVLILQLALLILLLKHCLPWETLMVMGLFPLLVAMVLIVDLFPTQMELLFLPSIEIRKMIKLYCYQP